MLRVGELQLQIVRHMQKVLVLLLVEQVLMQKVMVLLQVVIILIPKVMKPKQ